MTRLPAILLLTLILSACAGAGALRPGTDSAGEATLAPPGLTMLYRQKPEAVFQAALSALPQAGLRVLEADPAKRYILAERGLNLMSNGENVGVYLAPHESGTQVTVTSRRKTPTNVLAKDWAMPVHLQLGAVLGGAGRQP
ncbi:MAG: hypothetical protein KKA55_02930 [Proteobacteria bacterium]|nr:hypothetical protein [Pseudomonadota bacterium]MBU1594472.1 hypothetical protein [Pseudomonadota bacterium]